MANTYSLLFETPNSEYGTIASALIDPRNDYTIEMWVKINSEIGSGVYEFFHLENDTAKHVIYCQYEYNGGTRRLNFQQDRWVIVGSNARYTVTLGTSEWNHLAFVKSGTTTQIYFNTVAVGTTGSVDNTAGSTSTNNRCEIGAGATVGTTTRVNYSNAKIDELRVWNAARSQVQLAANWKTELIGSETNLVEYIRFNDGSGTTATATTGTNASLVNTPTWSTDIPDWSVPEGGYPIFFGNTAIV